MLRYIIIRETQKVSRYEISLLSLHTRKLTAISAMNFMTILEIVILMDLLNIVGLCDLIAIITIKPIIGI
jgi:hypothetical protein